MLTLPSPPRSAKLGEDIPSADKASITSDCVCILLFLNGWWGAKSPLLIHTETQFRLRVLHWVYSDKQSTRTKDPNGIGHQVSYAHGNIVLAKSNVF